MDRHLNSAVAYQHVGGSGGMPPEARLGMLPQDLRYKPSRRTRERSTAAVSFARFILVAITLGVSTYGIYQMLQVVRFASMTLLQGTMIFFFAVSLGWIAFAAGSVLAGASKRRDPTGRAGPASDSPGHAGTPRTSPDGSLTALVMPIYNEDPVRTTAALRAMAEALKDIEASSLFEIVVLSDSTNADSWIRETAAIHRLRTSLLSVMPVWYRRRWKNVARKSGNLEDFVTRWGGRYDHMIVLDADSLIDAPTLLRLVQVMLADPALGILQTAPQLIGARTFFGRLQQFAACVYGPVITRGLAAWSGDSCNYWGHNAIIRMTAFAQNCGLPILKGRKPFGGHVLSHDFVEAALMRRGGWKIRMATDFGGSWEESPPSLIDVAIRDRRWAQGNLQHMKIIGAAGLSFTSRLHLGIGIMSYLSSPLWLLMLGVGFALSVQSHLIRPEYFNHDFQLFPTWPRFDVELMMTLFWFSMVVLLIPKMLGLTRALLSRRIRRGGGGVIGIVASFVLETILSALYAPILMIVQSRHVFEVFMGRDSGWKPQRRDGGGTSWSDAWEFHKRHMLLSCMTAAIVYFLSPSLLAWVSPALLGLIFAVPLSRASGSESFGLALSKIALLRTPEEVETPALVMRRRELIAHAQELPEDGLRYLARDREARVAHIDDNLPRPTEPRGMPDPHAFTAEQKLIDARSLDEVLQWLTPIERVEVAGNARLLNQLALLPDAQPPGFTI
ncbi:MAG TPA: glucans biosynthesis glucosyltransferase MdoH [Steroidobacteraceae bacterium]|jgi:membrane glycosyltransferase|nr:glucans biosynthesis glucosyltransferase MdoH [Steroidobacteraceae bacterium]